MSTDSPFRSRGPITDADALEVMKMAVAGQLNVDLCATLLGAGAKPVGLHGASSRAIEATKRPPTVVSGGGPEPIDFGHVGNVVGFNTELLSLLSQAGYVPVLSSLGVDAHANVLNINADIVANRLAAALGADHLVLVTGAPGVLRDVTDPSSRIATLTVVEARRAIDDGIVAGGMIPKLEETIGVLAAGQLAAAHIVGGIAPGDILRELDAPGSVGTALLG